MEGYAKVAHLMATQEEFAILRRFRELNMQRLLYLQAEIIHLRSEVEQLAKGMRFMVIEGFMRKTGGL